MKILLVSTLKRKVNLQETASRSQIIAQLADGLVKKGHQVSLLGTKDTQIPGVHTIPVIEQGWVDLPAPENPFFRDLATLVQLARKIVTLQSSFDLIHNHTYPEFIIPLIENELATPLITTVHIQGTDYLDETLSLFKKTYLISISQAHRQLFKKAKIYKVIHNGVNTEIFSFEPKKEDYLLWIGRLSKAKNKDGSFMDPKGVRWAIELARQTNQRLILTGNVEDKEFYNQDVKPYLNDKIQWYGPVSTEQELKREEIAKLMQKAKAYLMTINWYEPFGLVMTEAMSCGTPVIGFNRGSVSELVKDGATGYVVEPETGIEGLKKALQKISEIQPQVCRDHVINNFSLKNMVNNYENAYLEILKNNSDKS